MPLNRIGVTFVRRKLFLAFCGFFVFFEFVLGYEAVRELFFISDLKVLRV